MNFKRLMRVKDTSDLFAEKVKDINKSISYEGEIIDRGEHSVKRNHGSVYIGSDEYVVTSVDVTGHRNAHYGCVWIEKISHGVKKEYLRLEFYQGWAMSKKNIGGFKNASDVKNYEYPYDYISFPNLMGAIHSAKQILIYELEKSVGAES